MLRCLTDDRARRLSTLRFPRSASRYVNRLRRDRRCASGARARILGGRRRADRHCDLYVQLSIQRRRGCRGVRAKGLDSPVPGAVSVCRRHAGGLSGCSHRVADVGTLAGNLHRGTGVVFRGSRTHPARTGGMCRKATGCRCPRTHRRGHRLRFGASGTGGRSFCYRSWFG